MDAITSQLQAMMMTNPDRNTTRGQKQASRRTCRRKRASKAKYNSEYYKINKYAINRRKAVGRGNSKKRSLKQATIRKWNIKWDQKTGKFYWKFMLAKMHHLFNLLELPASGSPLRH